ncbi:unnamed protein product, partial [Mesorhabditis belari]|uniref:TIL domain-containing protein n=1 Tax=Mesorhabditis belari TaxID=2138241 RepID=A0AAF3EEJ5_9BILA
MFKLFLFVAFLIFVVQSEDCPENEVFEENMGCDSCVARMPHTDLFACAAPPQKSCYCPEGFGRLSEDHGGKFFAAFLICLIQADSGESGSKGSSEESGECPENELFKENNGCDSCVARMPHNSPFACGAPKRKGCYCPPGFGRLPAEKGKKCVPLADCPPNF